MKQTYTPRKLARRIKKTGERIILGHYYRIGDQVINEYPTKEEILNLQKAGHTFHCAMRILAGDGECECNRKDCIPGGISRAMYAGVCFVCLKPKGSSHEDWCRNN